MIVKSYEVTKNVSNFSSSNLVLLYGENIGLKKDIKDFIKKSIVKKNDNAEMISLYENEILNNDENFNNFIYSGSLFGNKKIISIFEATDKIFNKINNIYDNYIEDIFIIIFSGVLEKKSKLRNFFEKSKKTICIPCYLDSEKDLEIIASKEFKKNNISISREAINLLIEKSNSDRNNLKNEMEKIKSYSLNKKNLDLEDIKLLINFTGNYKSDILVNECLCGNISEYKKIIGELYGDTTNQILLLRILSNKVQRLLNIKEQKNVTNNLENLINYSKPPIFWKEKPIVKKQLSIWSLDALKTIINKINNTELMCKKNPVGSKIIFFNLFLQICLEANSFS